MPELPEVETIRRGLSRLLAGKKIIDVDMVWPGSLRGRPSVFTARIKGASFTSFDRKGKFIMLGLNTGDGLIIHLKMTGKLLVSDASGPVQKHARIIFKLEGGQELRFIDLRKFGYVKLINGSAGRPPELDALGPDALDPGLKLDDWLILLSTKKASLRPVKAALLDQSFVSGIGNIYADESLHAAGLRPDRPIGSLTEPEFRELYGAIREVLREAVKNGGTTFSDYVNAQGEPGGHRPLLKVYGREGKLCRRCGRQIKKTRLAGRGTYFCSNCQR